MSRQDSEEVSRYFGEMRFMTLIYWEALLCGSSERFHARGTSMIEYETACDCLLSVCPVSNSSKSREDIHCSLSKDLSSMSKTSIDTISSACRHVVLDGWDEANRRTMKNRHCICHRPASSHSCLR